MSYPDMSIQRIKKIFKENNLPEFNSINYFQLSFLIVDPSEEKNRVYLEFLSRKTGKNKDGIFVHLMGHHGGFTKKLQLAQKYVEIFSEKRIASEVVKISKKRGKSCTYSVMLFLNSSR